MEGHLLDQHSLMYAWLRPDVVRQLFDAHNSGQSDNHKILFSLVAFEEWLKTMHI